MGSRPWLARWPVLAWFGVLALAAVPAGAPAQLPGMQACALQGRCPPIAADPLQRDGFALRLESAYRGDAAGAVPNAAGRTAQDAARDDPIEQISRGNSDVADGRFDAAGERYAAALRLAQARRDAEAEAAAQANLGVLAAAQGRYAQAREKLELAQRLFEALASGATPAQPPTMPPTADFLRRYGALVGVPFDPSVLAGVAAQTAAAGQFMAQRLRSAARVRARLNLANLAGQLGQYADAEAQLQQLLAGLTPEQAQEHQRSVLAELAVLYRQSGRTAEAEQFSQRAAAAPYTPSLGAFTGGLVSLGRSSAAPGPTLSAEGERLRPSHYAEAAHARLLAEAEERERAGDLPAALNAYARAAMLAAVIEAPERERTVLAQLARLQAAQGAGDVAIFHAKRAVNLAQRLRGQLGTLDRQARQAYLADKKRSYALLAAALLQRERLAEAEQVLRLLKEDEGQQFAAGPARGERGRIPYDAAETAWLAKYDAVAERTRALEREWAKQQKGVFGGVVDARRDQEEGRRQQALQAERMLATFEAQFDPAGDTMRQARAAAAKPPAARSAAEREQVLEAQFTLRLIADMLGDLAASLRQFRRDARFFLTPPTAEESVRLDQIAARVERTRVAYIAGAEELGPRPAGADSAAGQLAKFLQSFTGDSSRQWAIDRELEELDAQRERLDTALAAELPRTGAAQRAFAAADAALLETGRAAVAALPAGTVAVYYLAGETQLELLLVQRDARRAFRVALPRAQLEEQIRAFRALLQNPRSDPRAAAKALHEHLIAPLESALREARASTLMLSLDGQLRYLPFAALHDGQAWLAERYAVNLYTTAAPAALVAAPARRWRAAAFGSTAGGAGFGPLPAVRSELEGVVRDAALGTQGVLPGVIRLDRNFTAAALRSVLREKHQVVHIASHFAFRPGEPAESFLLLGDGGRLTLAEMAAAEYRFDQVDLVTLSACDTALSGADGFGQEVEGLGTLLQGQGAAAVLATLWSVADDSTSQYMRTLYALREQRGLTRAQAVREAQLALLRRGPAAAGGAVQRGAARADPAAPPRDEPAAPYAHPYFWAPFVLMGNWL